MKHPLQTFPVSAGLLEPRHVQAIDPSSPWPIYLWFLEHVTRDEENGEDFLGIVLSGRPVSIQQIAEELGMKGRACRRHLARLVKAGYIVQKQTGVGTCTYTVTKSKKWAWKRRTRTSKAPEIQTSLLFPGQDGSAASPHQKVASGPQPPHQILDRSDQKVVSAEGGTRARSQESQRSKAHRGSAVEVRSPETQEPPSAIEMDRNPKPSKSSNVPDLARKVIEILSVTNTIGNAKAIERSIVAEAAYRACSPNDAAQAIAQNGMNDRRRGIAIDRWYFEDTKWRRTGKLECSKSDAAPPASEGIKRELQERREIWNRRAAAGIQ